jgi:sugar lactone lactonase YvrE
LGAVTTLAGNEDSGFVNGTGTESMFYSPQGIAVDSLSNVYVADTNNNVIRKIDTLGEVSTFAGSVYGYSDGSNASVKFASPQGLAVDSDNNVYVADTSNKRIRKISAGNVTTIAGNGVFGYYDSNGTAAQFAYPTGVVFYNSATLYVIDQLNDKIRKINAIGDVTTIAGFLEYKDGNGTAALFQEPFGIAVDKSNNTIYIADTSNQRIRKINSNGDVTTLAGSGIQGYADGVGVSAQFNNPTGVAIDSSGNVFVADSGNFKIRKITPQGIVSTLAGSTGDYQDGTGSSAKFANPQGIAIDSQNIIYVAENTHVRKVTQSGVVTTLAGSTQGYQDGNGNSAKFNYLTGVAVDSSFNLYVTDYTNHRIRKITPEGIVSTLAGADTSGIVNGNGASAKFYNPFGIAVDAYGNVYVADSNNNDIRLIAPNGDVSTLAGTGSQGNVDGNGINAKFNTPMGVAVDSSGNVYVADHGNSLVRKIMNNIIPLVPAPSLTSAIAAAGPDAVTSSVTATVEAVNHLVVKVSSSAIAAPSVGDSAPTGEDVTNPYIVTNSIHNVDAVVRKYLGVYEVNSSNTVVKFKLIILTASQIKAMSPPTLSASTIEMTNENVMVTITYPNGAALRKYKIGMGGSLLNYAAPVIVSANDTIYAYYIDELGNQSDTGSIVINNIDILAPTTTALETKNLTSRYVTIDLQSADNVGGSTFFTIDGGSIQTGNSFVLTGEGAHIYTYWSIDSAGNEEIGHSKTIKVELVDYNNNGKVYIDDIVNLIISGTLQQKDINHDGVYDDLDIHIMLDAISPVSQ